MKRLAILVLLLASLSIACDDRQVDGPGVVEGYRPIYAAPNAALTTSVEGPAILSKPGKIYTFGSWLYLTDKGSGVHIIDISNVLSPRKHAFIRIPGIEDVAVKGSYLFADNITDIVVFDISDLSNIRQTQRIEDVYPFENQQYPRNVTGYFECVDESKGYVIGWEKTILDNPKCKLQ